MRVRDLGALTVAVDELERPVAGSRAATILAVLVINANQRVSVQTLLDATWGEDATDATVSTLESHIWRLRQLLEPGRTNRQAPTVLINENGGYRLVASGHTIDSVSFQQICGDVRDLLAAGRPSAAVQRADDALALWRGQPYGALGDQSWAAPAVARLEELRWQLNERRIDALIAMGRLDQSLADLEPLIAASPFHEKLRAQQMLALYRSGRVEEALAAFQHARAILVDEVGADPGPELQSLHTKILNHDAQLAGPPAEPAPHPNSGQVHLPSAGTPLVGRDVDVDGLMKVIGREPLATITGAAGVGKTRLAIEVGRLAAGSFPDGVWFVDLATLTDTELVVDAVVSTIGIAASPGATPLEDLVHYLRSRRLLLVLDNCEHVVSAVAHIVETVLAQGNDVVQCAMLATSREPLDVDGEVTWAAQPLGVPEFDDVDAALNPADAPAVQLFVDRLRRVAPAMSIDDDVLGRAASICVALDGLPLAIELAAARARSHSLHDIERAIRTDLGGLARPGRARSDHRATVRSAVDFSHHTLTPVEQIVHRRLAVLPGPFTSDAAVSVVAELPPTEVGDALAQLVHRSMLSSTATSGTGERTVFRQLATVRAHAAHALETAGESGATTRRRNMWAINLIDDRPRLGSRDEADWFRAVDANFATVRAALASSLIDESDPAGGRLAVPLGFYWYYRAKVTEASRWLRLACEASTDHTDVRWLTAALVFASASAVQGRVEAARPLISEALRVVPTIADEDLIEVGECLVALGAGVWVHQVSDVVIDVHAVLRRVADRAGDADLHLFADAFGCMATAAEGRLDEAAARAADVYRESERRGNSTAGWIAAAAPLTAALLNSQPELGIPWVRRVMQAHLSVGGVTAGMFVETRANYETQRGSHKQAARLYAAARVHTRRAAMVWPRRSITNALMEETRAHLGQRDFEAAWRDGELLDLAEISRLG